MATKVNQKEYLKKYLASDLGDDKKKKKKRKDKSVNLAKVTVKIIDDDVDISKLQNIHDDDLDLFQTGEDAPQIVGVIDDRPPELQALDYKNSTKWKVVSNDDGFESNLTVQQVEPDGRVISKEPFVDLTIKSKVLHRNNKKKKRKKYSDDEASPKRKRESSNDNSPPRKRRNKSEDPSPPPRKQKISREASPARNRISVEIGSPPRKRKDSSPKPLRKAHRNRWGSPLKTESEVSKRKSKTPDLSPKRKHTNDSNKRYNRHKSRSRSPQRDLSPPRRKTYSETNRNKTPNLSPRRIKKETDDLSPPRRRITHEEDRSQSRRNTKNNDNSPPRRRKHENDDISPPRRRDRNFSNESPQRSDKMTKTLDGKTAGLQNATALRVENSKFRERENKIFNAMTEEMSGKYAEVVQRDRATGKRRDADYESEKQKKKDEQAKARKEIYDRWGAGLKQVEEHKKRLDEISHEMSKPLARYSDDNDLDEHLKKQERAGDPMLQYIREKQKEKLQSKGLPVLPTYQGTYPDNRFNIRPGYRWDGVDRSNGFEKKWFDVISKRKAVEEEAYRYSTEDM